MAKPGTPIDHDAIADQVGGLPIRAVFDAYGHVGKDNYLEQLAVARTVYEAGRLCLDLHVKAAKWHHTWAEIGDVLGVTKQAAQQRFAAVVDDDLAGQG